MAIGLNQPSIRRVPRPDLASMPMNGALGDGKPEPDASGQTFARQLDARPNPLDPSLISAAIEQQLGLAVTSRKQAVDFFAIDGVEKATAGN